MIKEMVLTLLLSLSPWHEDINEENEARKARLGLISDSQVEVADKLTCGGQYGVPRCVVVFAGTRNELLSLLITAGWWETRYSARIHAGDCKEDECDGGAARGVYQVQQNGFVPKELWEKSLGDTPEATYAATMAAALSFSQAWKACHARHGMRGVWSAYGRGKCVSSYRTLTSRVRWSKRQLLAISSSE